VIDFLVQKEKVETKEDDETFAVKMDELIKELNEQMETVRLLDKKIK